MSHPLDAAINHWQQINTPGHDVPLQVYITARTKTNDIDELRTYFASSMITIAMAPAAYTRQSDMERAIMASELFIHICLFIRGSNIDTLIW